MCVSFVFRLCSAVIIRQMSVSRLTEAGWFSVDMQWAVKAGRIRKETARQAEYCYVWMDDLKIFDEEGTKNQGQKSWELPLSKAFMS